MQNDSLITSYPNLLLIAGQQQNVGKTTLASRIIAHFTRNHKITGLKVTPHFHEHIGNAMPIEKSEGYRISQESSPNSNKDTSIMLKAGAEHAYLLEAKPEFMEIGFKQALKNVPQGNLIVCESAGLKNFLEPGVFLGLRQLYCKTEAIKNKDILNTADRIVTFTGNGFDFSMDDIFIESGAWKLKNIKDETTE